uniref:Uncharacterized protein n=1 Tax=Chromera velia CCMP2878 TaxID=1169474 RepID=A0A0G4H977_9ALVE|mmetsp:Transcript_35191/g.69417  ORF Transcript_35191/g.69417 Transcript_35191/m.69417 type:complete len:1249 (+) Transcript_35191:68-3814(+)|eukprot:Cvel_5913.t1-p1 / transcript=Cvel_5913.t1 / gene=Cvel_5913 / organism=Chromera_velia_CCMP2878 / gene_product=Clumping factor A, putative / transcript_product=Clumping factor A, putative / location=Cvel_scaffold282:94857-104984(-) / protein_length=1248 / sequence_SO=supercontig / SO=protein_coding / is_pseudo=false
MKRILGLGALLAASASADLPTKEEAEAFFQLATADGTSCSFVITDDTTNTANSLQAVDPPAGVPTAATPDPITEDFEWIFTPAEGGLVNIVSKGSATCLTGDAALTPQVTADECDNSEEQEWNVTLSADGTPPVYQITSPFNSDQVLTQGTPTVLVADGAQLWARNNGTCTPIPGKFPWIPKLSGVTHYKSWDHVPLPPDNFICDPYKRGCPLYWPSTYYDESGSNVPVSSWNDHYGTHSISPYEASPKKLLLGVEAIPAALVNDPAFPEPGDKAQQLMDSPYYFLKKSVFFKRVFFQKYETISGHSFKFSSGFGPTDFNAVHDVLPFAVALNEPNDTSVHPYYKMKSTALEMLAESVYFQIEQDEKFGLPKGQMYPVDYFVKLEKTGYHVAAFVPVFHYELVNTKWITVLDVEFVGKPKDPQFAKLVVECGGKFKSPAPPAVSASAFVGGNDGTSSNTGDDGSDSGSSATSNPVVGENTNDITTGRVDSETGDQQQQNDIGPLTTTSETGDSNASSSTGPVDTGASVQNGPNTVDTGGSTADGTVESDVGNDSANENGNGASSTGTNENAVDTSSDNGFEAGVDSGSNAGSNVNVTDTNTNAVDGDVDSSIGSENGVSGENDNAVGLTDNSATENSAGNKNSADQSNSGSVEASNEATTDSGSDLDADLGNDSSNTNGAEGSVDGENENTVDAGSQTDLDTDVSSGSSSGSDVDVQDTNDITLNPDVKTGSESINDVSGSNENDMNLEDSSDRSTEISSETSSDQSNEGSVDSKNDVITDADINGSVDGSQDQETNVDTTDVNTNTGVNTQGQSSENESNSESSSGSASKSNNNVESNSESYTGDSTSNAAGGNSTSQAISNSGGNVQNFSPTIKINIDSSNSGVDPHKKDPHLTCDKLSQALVDDFFAVHEDTTLVANALINDPVGWEVIVSATSPTTAEGGTVFFLSSDGTFEYSPAKNFVGTDFFFYTAKKKIHDSKGDFVICKATAKVTIKVIGKDDGPQAKDLSFTLKIECKSKTIPSLQGMAEAWDIDTSAEHVTFPLVSRPSEGVLEWSEQTGQFTYTPPAGKTSSFDVSWQYTARDKASESAPATITVRVEVVGDCKAVGNTLRSFGKPPTVAAGPSVSSSSEPQVGAASGSGGVFDFFGGGGDLFKLDGLTFGSTPSLVSPASPSLEGFDFGKMKLPAMDMGGMGGMGAVPVGGAPAMAGAGTVPQTELPGFEPVPVAPVPTVAPLPGIDFDLLNFGG